MALVVSGLTAGQQSHPDPALTETLDQISLDQIQQHLAVLGHDSLEGRGTGSVGAEKAADYIAFQLRSCGVMPCGDEKTFFQKIPFHGSTPLDASQLKVYCADTSFALHLWDDYILFNTGAQTFIPTPAPMVFVGYGIFAPEYDYNDYQDMDVENTIVVFLAGEPSSNDPDYFDGPLSTVYTDPVMKHRLALARGALGSMMIPLPREKRYMDWAYWKKQFEPEDIRLAYGVSDNMNVLLHFNMAPHLFGNAPYQFRDIFSFDSSGTMRSFPLRTSASFRGVFRERDFVASNVVGMLAGNEPLLRDSYVVISAHYDHLGIGVPVDGDSIYNGVVDNAIGVSAMLEVARLFSQLTVPLDRSILFLFLTGEEKGLLGSRYYCDHPVVPLYQTIAAINVDGLAMFDTFNSIYGVGAHHSTLGDKLESVAGDLGLRISPAPPLSLEKDPFFCSDQLSFAQAGVPSILIMEGHEYQHLSYDQGIERFLLWGEQVYHTPFDDLNQEINYQAVLEHVQVFIAFTVSVANTYVAPQWNPGSIYMNARLQSIAERR